MKYILYATLKNCKVKFVQGLMGEIINALRSWDYRDIVREMIIRSGFL